MRHGSALYFLQRKEVSTFSTIKSLPMLYIPVPSHGPTNVTASWINSTTVKVAWLKLSLTEARGFITHYNVYAGNTKLIVSNSSSIAYINNLNTKSQHDISVTANTKVGESRNNSIFTLSAYG